MKIPLRAGLVVLLGGLGLQHVGAFGVALVHLPSISPAPQNFTIGSNPDEWQGINAYVFNPMAAFSAGQASSDPALAAMLQKQPSVSVRTCYDTEALYVACEWTDSDAGTNKTGAGEADRWFDGGESIELHIATDRMLHIACWAAAKGKGLSIMARNDDQKNWEDGSQTFTAIGVPGVDASHYAMKIRIPWAAVTTSGKIPSDGKLQLGADFAWNAIDSKMIDSLRNAAQAANGAFPGVPFCFLSSHVPELGTQELTNPLEWGQLTVVDLPQKDQAAESREQTSLTQMALGKARSAPAMDGTLAGWDPNDFQTASCFPGYWGDRFQCHLAAQYDAQNLYLAAHFTSSGKFSNVRPESSQQGFNGGDALQFRLSDGSKTINLCGWFDSGAGKPALTADNRDVGNPFLLKEGAQEQFRTDDDGKGYVQEITLPWKILFGSAPSTGLQLKATFQLWFADHTPRFSLFSQMTLERRGAIPVAYKMPVDGQLTLGLFDKSGRLLKWLVQDDYRRAGENQEFWDGLDQWNHPVAAGDYDLRAIYHPPLSLDYQMTVCNPGTPPWPTPDDKGDWLSDEATPQAVATDGKWIFLGSPGSEKGFAVIGLDEKGQRQWGLSESINPRSVSLSVAGNNLYILFSGPEITDNNSYYTGHNGIGRALLMCLDKKTGRPVKFTREVSHLKVATWPYRDAFCWLWDLRNNRSFSPFNYGGQPRYSNIDVGDSTDALGMAVLGSKIYISMPYENKLLVLDAETGKPVGDDIPIDSPAGLCVRDDHTLLAVSGTKVVSVDVATKQVTSLIEKGLVAPDSITVDKTGQIYVSDWGTSFQVKAFDATGKFLRAIGTPGGRPWVGKWDKNGMLVPRGIGVTDEGNLWVAEDDGSPKRVSVWNAATGAFIKDYIGPTPYGGGNIFWFDPKDPTIVHVEGARFKVDFKKKTYTPEAIDYRKASIDTPFTPNGHNLNRYQPRVLYRDGHEYLFTAIDDKGVTLLQRQDDVYQPVAAVGSFPTDSPAPFHPNSDYTVTWDSDIMNHVFPHYFPAFFAGHMGDNYSWTDDNGDNVVQPDEMRWYKFIGEPAAHPFKEGLQEYWNGGAWNLDIAPDFSIFFPERFADKIAIMRLAPRGWTEQGAPIYDIADAKVFVTRSLDAPVDAIHVTLDKKVIVAYNYEYHAPAARDSIECLDMEGHSLWSIAMPARAEGKNVHATSIAYDFVAPGIGDVVCTWAYHGSQRPYFFTTDGLYVGTVLNDSMLGPASNWSESARYFYQAPDGTPFIINGAKQQENIFKIRGLSGGQIKGSLAISQNDVETAAALRNVPEVKVPPKAIIRLSWLAKAPVVDGDLSDWNMDDGVSLDGGKGHTAEIALGRDKDNLYLAYRVHEPTPPLTNGGEDGHDLYVTGDCVDLMLGTDSKADPHRRDAVAGDERLLFSVFQGQSIAVLYKPVVPGTVAPVHIGSAQVDQIIRLDSAKVAVKRDAASGMYTVEAAVPLKDLGIDPAEKDSLQGDVGVIYADESGRNRAQRLYYYNKNTDIVADIPTETRLQPSEWGAVQFPLGLNLIHNGGFEENFVSSADHADEGWFIDDQSNGSNAVLSSDSAHSGHQSLLLETPVALTVDPAAYNDPEYDGGFIKKFNDGKRSHAEIVQRVPVIAGHQYSIRYYYRNEDFQEERKEVGHPRGYISFGGRINWDCTPPNSAPGEGVGETKESHFDWQESFDQRRGADLPRVFTAPQGAVAALLNFELVTYAEGHLPKAYVDDVEFVDVTTPP